MSILTKIRSLTKSLYPTGRVFRQSSGGVLDQLQNGLSLSEQRAYDDAVSILDSALPDNDNFTSQDATDWERRLGLITNSAVPLADRKLAIIRKMNHPGEFAARQHFLYIQTQIRLAGFDVYLHENIFDPYPYGDPVTNTPFNLASLVNEDFVAAYNNFEFGELQYGQIGEYGLSLVVNNIEEAKDAIFDVGDNLRSTFFVGGLEIGQFADVDLNRQDEFRQLILRLKPTQTVGYLFINYI